MSFLTPYQEQQKKSEEEEISYNQADFTDTSSTP